MAENWDDLRVFLAVARAESLGRASQIAKQDPATLSRRIKRLEDHLGVPLFLKSPQGYGLTEAGERLRKYAEASEVAFNTGAAELSGSAETLAGAFRIGAPDGCANFVLPQVCAKIADEHPDLEIQIVALPRVFNLTRREADMAISVSPPTAGRLTVQKITDYHLHLAAHEDYLNAHPKIETMDDLRGHRITGYISDMIFDKELDYFGQLGEVPAQFTSNSFSVQFNLVRQGYGVGILHDFAVPIWPGLKRILTDQLSLTRSFYLVRHADDRQQARQNRMARLLADGIRGEIARLESLA
ncbi:LysR family transcriptional regulator [Actibacterium pelagium]|uniref:LysR family transcriptional regulator n=1 Tax=Actibacterium pelagium TaxID=2029103 RepID=A0A917AFM5_9RHOB|nr:LysR family transcriptional regulator [Actibacterium pelagium]GGE45108.1 LysR family transcriptional regulator [Actibacterium pelagium]